MRKRQEGSFQGIVIQILHDVISEKDLPFEHYVVQEEDRVDIIFKIYKKT